MQVDTLYIRTVSLHHTRLYNDAAMTCARPYLRRTRFWRQAFTTDLASKLSPDLALGNASYWCDPPVPRDRDAPSVYKAMHDNHED